MGQLLNISDFVKKPFTIECKTPDKIEMEIYGPIASTSWGEECVSAKMVVDALNKNKDAKNITIHINSPGGDVFEGVAIYNRLKQHKAKIVVYVDALAASIASIIAMAGDEIVMGQGSQFMIHKPFCFAVGNSSELLGIVDRLDDVEEQLISIYAKRTGLSRVELKKMLSEETWMDSSESVALKFADKEIEKTYAIAASCDNAVWMRKKPNLTNAEKAVKEKLQELKRNVDGFLARK